MATIEKRTDGTGNHSYRVKVRLKGYPPQSATFPRLTDAKRWGQSVEAAIREGRHFATTEAKRHTVAGLIDRYVRDVLPSKKPKTQAPQRHQLAWWKDRIGERVLADCTPALIAECRDALFGRAAAGQQNDQAQADAERDRSPATVNRYLAVLSHVFTVALKEWGWVEANPLLKVTKPKEPGGRVRFLSDHERERLLRACRESSNQDLYLAVVLSLSTGARQQEVMGLRWPQVDFTRRVAVLHETKNGERRLLSLAGPALELLRERAKVRRLDTDLVFPGRTCRTKPGEPPKPPAPVDLRAPWETALKRAGVADFRWHDLRHSAASYLAMGGASLPEIAAVLGHKTMNMVKRYAHLSEDHTADVVKRMNAQIFGDG